MGEIFPLPRENAEKAVFQAILWGKRIFKLRDSREKSITYRFRKGLWVAKMPLDRCNYVGNAYQRFPPPPDLFSWGFASLTLISRPSRLEPLIS